MDTTLAPTRLHALQLGGRYGRPGAPQGDTLLFMLLACVLLMLGNGCAGNRRQETLSRALLVVDTARIGFTTWDDAHQQELVKTSTSYAQGEAALAAYRERRLPVLLAFELTYQAIASAALDHQPDGLASAQGRLQQLILLLQELTHAGD